MMKNKNTLYKEKYIISQELHNALSNEHYDNNKNKSVEKNLGIYLVVFRVLNKDNEKILIYNYIYYPTIFLDTFITFMITRNEFSLRYSEWGDTFFIINKNVFDKSYSFKYNKEQGDYARFMFNDISIVYEYFNALNNYYSGSSINILVNLINRLTFVTLDMKEMFDLLRFAVNKDYTSYIYRILKPFIEEKDYDINNINNEEEINLNNCCVFVVNDIESFKKTITAEGYTVNEGPQKWRGQINSMSGLLSSIDLDYRNSLYHHNNYHVRFGKVDTNYLLPKSKFSFRNVHMNLGNVRWYSSKITRSSVKKELAKRLEYQSFKTDSEVYLHLSRFLNQSPLNEATERELESFLLEFSYRKIATKEDYKYDFLNNKQIKKLLMDSVEVLNNYITNFLKKTYNIKAKRPSQNTITKHYMQIIIQIIGSSFIIELSLGVIARVISSYNKLEDDCVAVNIFNDLGNVIVSKYYYTLYRTYVIINTELFINQCLNYLELKGDSTISSSDKEKMANIIDTLNKKLNKYEVYEIFFHINNILSINNMKNVDLNNTEWIVQYSLSDWKKDNKNIVDLYNDNTLINSLGAILVEWWNEAELIQQNTVTIGRNDRRNYIFPSVNITKNLDSKDNTIKHLPIRIPMIVKPKLYYRVNVNNTFKERLGGYLLNDEKVTDSLIIPNNELKTSSTIINNSNIIYNLVNNINSVGFKINNEMLDFIDDYGDEFKLLLGNIEIDLLKPRITKSEYAELESYISKLDLQENILGLAKVYSKIPEFYLPVRIDYRGRVNCISQYLNYQSTELAKSLLLFSKGEKLMKNDINGIMYFKAYGANCFGNKLDKKSWLERSKWIDDNEENILNFTNGKLINKAENKLLFSSFCIEYLKWKKSYNNIETSYFITHLPIQLDATCNGYQHLSLLTLDYDMGKELNLSKSSRSDVPKDYYNYMMIKLKDLFKDKFNNSEKWKISSEDVKCYERLSNIIINRSLIKKAIMTIPYNVSTHQMIIYLKEHFNKIEVNKDKVGWSPYLLEYQLKLDNNIVLCSRDITLIALGLREVLELNFPKLKLLVMYLRSIASICNKLKLTIPWGTSSGLLVNQSYMSFQAVKLRPFSFSKGSFILQSRTNKINASKQVRAFMPNLVHSLDAASLALLADYYFNGDKRKSFYAIHDCFAVTASNVELLISYLKLVYIKIYSEDDYLRKLDKEMKQYIKHTHGDECFNDDTLEIKQDGITLKYPDINYVLGNKLPSPDWIKDSSYIIT